MDSTIILNKTLQICFIGLNSILLISTIPVICKIIHQHVTKDDDDKPKVLHFILGLLFSISTLLALLVIIIMSVLDLHHTEQNHSIFHIFWILFAICYASQSYFLLLLLFFRLYYIFLGSIFCISLKIVKLFKVLFICTPIILIFIPFLHYIRGTITWSFIVAFLSFIMLASMITLIFLFLFKLYKVLNQSSNDLQLTSLMTKATILGTISILLTAVSALLIITRYTIFTDPTYYIIQIICQWFCSLNIYINFICIILSYSSFNTYYNTLCGCIHSKCRDIILFFVFRNVKIQQLSQSVMITNRQRRIHVHPHSMPVRYEPTDVNTAYSTTKRPSVITVNSTPVSIINMNEMSPTFDGMSPTSPSMQRIPTISRSSVMEMKSISERRMQNNGINLQPLKFKRIESTSGSITPVESDIGVGDRKLNIKELQLSLDHISEEANDIDENNMSANKMESLKNHISASKLKEVMEKVSDNGDDGDYVNLNEAE